VAWAPIWPLRGAALPALAVALIVPLALAGCGRKGPLDPPPSASIPPPAPAAQSGYIDPMTPTGGAQQARQQPPPAPPQQKTFLLDPLLR
jgi:predicted small lipoprotein YifL